MSGAIVASEQKRKFVGPVITCRAEEGDLVFAPCCAEPRPTRLRI